MHQLCILFLIYIISYTIRFGRPIPILIPNDVTLTSLKSTDSRTRICEATNTGALALIHQLLYIFI